MVINLFGLEVEKDKYELLRFLNRRHFFLLRLILASLGFLFTLLITKSWALTKQSFIDFKNDDFKIGFRRAAKILNIYRAHNVAKDDTFNFCEGLNVNALKDLREKFIAINLENGFDLDNQIKLSELDALEKQKRIEERLEAFKEKVS